MQLKVLRVQLKAVCRWLGCNWKRVKCNQRVYRDGKLQRNRDGVQLSDVELPDNAWPHRHNYSCTNTVFAGGECRVSMRSIAARLSALPTELAFHFGHVDADRVFFRVTEQHQRFPRTQPDIRHCCGVPISPGSPPNPNSGDSGLCGRTTSPSCPRRLFTASGCQAPGRGVLGKTEIQQTRNVAGTTVAMRERFRPAQVPRFSSSEISLFKDTGRPAISPRVDRNMVRKWCANPISRLLR
jgi:hypothetical protein